MTTWDSSVSHAKLSCALYVLPQSQVFANHALLEPHSIFLIILAVVLLDFMK